MTAKKSTLDNEKVENWYLHTFKDKHGGPLIYKMKYSRISCYFKFFTKFAIDKGFDEDIAKTVCDIGYGLATITKEVIIIRKKNDILRLLKRLSVQDYPNNPDYYKKYYPIARALLVSYHSKYRSRNVLYHQVMYHHWTLAQRRKEGEKELFPKILCFEE